MKRSLRTILLLLAPLCLWATLAIAQSPPAFVPPGGGAPRPLDNGDIPTATQWNNFFESKQDYGGGGGGGGSGCGSNCLVNGGPLGTPSSGNLSNTTGFPASQLTGIVPVPQGGTGQSTFTTGGPLLGNGNSPVMQGTISGSSTALIAKDGAFTSGHCPQIDASGGLVDSGGACSTNAGVEYQSTVLSINLVPGVDCTGTTDSSAALNTMFSTISGEHIRLINTTNQPCHLVTYQQLHILNATDFWLDGDSETYGAGMTISGCGTPTNTLNGSNAVLYINGSFHWRVSGLLIEANGNTRCSVASTFTVSLQRDNTSGTYTDTDSIIDHSTFTSSVNGSGSYRFSNYRGILESATNGNGENLRLYDDNFLCQQSPSSWAVDIAGPFADMFDIHHNIFSYCMIDVFDNGSQGRVENNQAEAPGNYADFGAGGAFFYLAGYCPYGYDKIVISGNETDNSGPLFSNATDATASGGACVGGSLTIADNLIGPTNSPPIPQRSTSKTPLAFTSSPGTSSNLRISRPSR